MPIGMTLDISSSATLTVVCPSAARLGAAAGVSINNAATTYRIYRLMIEPLCLLGTTVAMIEDRRFENLAYLPPKRFDPSESKKTYVLGRVLIRPPPPRHLTCPQSI